MAKPWEFVVVTERKGWQRFALRWFSGVTIPRSHIVCANTSFLKNLFARFFGAGLQRGDGVYLLAAVELGLGTVWLGVHPIQIFSSQISRILSLPKTVKPLNVICVGYPAEEKPPGRNMTRARPLGSLLNHWIESLLFNH